MNPEVSSELSAMRARLARAEIVRSLTGHEETGGEKLLKAIFDADKPSSIARSESEINEEQVLQIQEKAHRLREWVIEHGEIESDQELLPYWLYKWQEVEISADEDTPEARSRPSSYLLGLVGYDQQGNEFTINFGFEDEFTIEIGFTNPEEPEKIAFRYTSGNQHLAGMTEEEYKIISHWLDHCLETI